jgi:predicted dehydrogenase
MSDRPVGLALLSFAHGHQRAWCRSLQADRRARVVCAWDDDAARGRAAADALGVAFEPELERALARPDVDAVTICAENQAHAGLAVAAAGAGKHVMMQKPMATTLADCDRIVEAVERAGVKYLQSYNLRFDPVHVRIKELVDAGAIGRVNVARRRHSHHFALRAEDRAQVLGFMTDPVRAGGGALMDEGAHVTLWYLWMFGPPASVSAAVETRTPGLAVEDNAAVLYRWADGMLGIHQTSWTEVAGDATTELFGERGTIIQTGADIASTRPYGPAASELRPLKLYTLESGRWEYPDVPLLLNRSALVTGPFVDMLVEGTDSPCDARTARLGVEMLLAAYRSSREGRSVPIPLAR